MKIFVHTDSVRLLNKIEKSGLYRSEGQLIETVRKAAEIKSVLISATAFIRLHAVGVAVIDKNNMLQVFVNEAFRRRGIGRELIKTVLQASGKRLEDVHAGYGEDCRVSGLFWDHLNVIVDPDTFEGYGLSKEDLSFLLEGKIPVHYFRVLKYYKWQLEQGRLTAEEYEQKVELEKTRQIDEMRKSLTDLKKQLKKARSQFRSSTMETAD